MKVTKVKKKPAFSSLSFWPWDSPWLSLQGSRILSFCIATRWTGRLYRAVSSEPFCTATRTRPGLSSCACAIPPDIRSPRITILAMRTSRYCRADIFAATAPASTSRKPMRS